MDTMICGSLPETKIIAHFFPKILKDKISSSELAEEASDALSSVLVVYFVEEFIGG
jgi:hypothetical protein